METLQVENINIELDIVQKDEKLWTFSQAWDYVYRHRNIFDDKTYRMALNTYPPIIRETSVFHGKKYYFLWAFLSGKILIFNIGNVSNYKLNKIENYLISKILEEAENAK